MATTPERSRLPYVESVIYDEFLVIFIMPDIITIEQARFDIVRLTGLAAYDFNLIPTDGKYRTEYSEGNKDYRGNRGQQIGYVIKGGTVVSFVLGAPVRVDGIIHVTAPAHVFTGIVHYVYSSPACAPEDVIGECAIKYNSTTDNTLEIEASVSYDIDLALVRIKVNWLTCFGFSWRRYSSTCWFADIEPWVGTQVQVSSGHGQVYGKLGKQFRRHRQSFYLKIPQPKSPDVPRLWKGMSGSLVTVPEHCGAQLGAVGLVYGTRTVTEQTHIMVCPLREGFRILEKLYQCKIEPWVGNTIQW